MINPGNYVKVWQEHAGQMVQIAKGFVDTIGNGSVTICADIGKAVERLPLAHILLEKFNPPANEMKPANMPYRPAIRNRATGNGFRGRGMKAHFKYGKWNNRRVKA